MADLYSKASFILTANAYSSSKLFSIKPTDGTGDLTFTRASSGSRVNSSGLIEFVNNNIPRLTYSGSSCPQFLFEPQRINSLVQSNGFNTTWTLNATTVTASQEISPDGTNNGWKLNETIGGATTHDIRQTSAITAISGTRYVISAYVKPAERNQVALQSDIGGAFDFTRFNLTGTGSVYPASIQPGHTASISPVGNGWYRITDMIVANASTTKYFLINLQSSSITTTPADSYAGTSNTAGIYIYGAQIEAGNYPTSYIPTTTAAVTRIVDLSDNTSFPTSLIGQTEGTVFVDYTPTFLSAPLGGGTVPGIFKIFSSGNNNIGIIQNGSDRIQCLLYSGSVPTTVINIADTISLNLSSSYKIAFAYSSSNSKLYINGTQRASSTNTYGAFSTPLNNLSLTDSNYSGTIHQNLFKTVALYKTRLTDSELIALTS